MAFCNGLCNDCVNCSFARCSLKIFLCRGLCWKCSHIVPAARGSRLSEICQCRSILPLPSHCRPIIIPTATPRLWFVIIIAIWGFAMLEAEESPKAEYQSSKEGIMECLSKVGEKFLRRWISFLCTSVCHFSHYMRSVMLKSGTPFPPCGV